jgi:hypothetical protein
MENEYEFTFENKFVKWTYANLDSENRSPDNRDLRAKIICDHPVFVKAFGSNSMVADSLGSLFSMGKKFNKEFFGSMEKSF